MEKDFVEYDAEDNLGRLWNRIGQLLHDTVRVTVKTKYPCRIP